MKINAQNLHYKTLNDQIKASAAQDIEVEHCIGQRYIGDGPVSYTHLDVYKRQLTRRIARFQQVHPRIGGK